MDQNNSSLSLDTVFHYLRHAPISLAIRELNRMYALNLIFDELGIQNKEVLDVGCGDGYWWSFFAKRGLRIYGIDISDSELKQAKKCLAQAESCDISTAQPFRGKVFDVAIGNCSLEHVPNLSSALRNIHLSLKEGAAFILFVPTPTWALQGNLQKLLLNVSPRAAMTFAGALNGFFQHWHLYDDKIWESVLREHGFDVRKSMALGSQKSEFLFRLFLPSAFGAFIIKKIFGSYPNRLFRFIPLTFFKFSFGRFARKLKTNTESSYTSLPFKYAYEYVFVAQKKGS